MAGDEIIQRLVTAGRAQGLPIIYSTSIRRPDRWDDGGWTWKNTRVKEKAPSLEGKATVEGWRIPEEIAPRATDIVIRKQKPSVFFNTNLMSYLTLLGVDSLIVAGTTTSGCVRASVVDAFSCNLRVLVVEDACFDRTQSSHALNLFDMHAKYADVIGSAEAIEHIRSVPRGLFVLPSGENMPETNPAY